jgi:hypothetical protein
MDEACSTYGKRIDVYRVVVEKPMRKRPLGRHRHRWNDDYGGGGGDDDDDDNDNNNNMDL